MKVGGYSTATDANRPYPEGHERPALRLLVIGSGPGGQKAAIAAAKLGKRAAVVERRHMVGGVCINTGTIPSKTLREAVLYLTGLNMRELYGQNYRRQGRDHRRRTCWPAPST